ncbi:unnamed protein product [Microthlaspi erraticum]|uniref:F-box domain-containing protein n=1 Tax=Microthlaspi erraticum TaxID=1685480 RepID=A0A6D2JRJ8_9BRAS|nr:unnamed protein product [Microthlaspi erraticum]
MEKEKQVIASSSPRKRKRRDDQEIPYDMVEEILLRLPVESLIRFKIVSKQWRSTIGSLYFQERHLRIVKQSNIDHPKILIVSFDSQNFEFRTVHLDSASLRTLNLRNIPDQNCLEASENCDGLICIYYLKSSIYVVNPATVWQRQVPLARFQALMQNATYTRETLRDIKPIPRLAFVKTSCDYKLVWLYNSDKYNSDAMSPNEGVTKCEVFDFRANAWRYLPCTPGYRIFDDQTPASRNGSVYWLTERYNGETKVIVLDLHTETFRMLPRNPVARSHPDHIDMCILDNRLCMSKRKRGTMIQEIWSLQSSSEDTWMKIYTIDLLSCSSWSLSGIGFTWVRRDVFRPCTPVGISKNKEILLTHRYAEGLVKYDPQTNMYSAFYKELSCRRVIPYFQSLKSHI